jgi:hypothetical protein
MDSNPWYQTVQHPIELIMNESIDATSQLMKGNVWAATKKGFNVYAKSAGLPVTPYNNFDMIRKTLTENK